VKVHGIYFLPRTAPLQAKIEQKLIENNYDDAADNDTNNEADMQPVSRLHAI
jgi:hypothetical protein